MISKIIKSIPNSITLLNLLSGIFAIYFSFSPMEKICGLYGWQMAAWMICAAALFDFLDGLAARLLNARSDIGKELDSLCDLVSFGVAPAMMLFNLINLHSNAGWWAFIAFFIPLMGALRLARFNVRDSGSTTFSGLPIPANAIFWIGYVSALAQGQFLPRLTFNAVIIVLISLLMVSNVKMFSLKITDWRLVANLGRYFTLLASALFIIFFGFTGFALSIALYILVSFLQNIIHISIVEE